MDRRGKKDATRFATWPLAARVEGMRRATTERVLHMGDCIVSTRTSTQQCPQLNLTWQGHKYQAMCKHFALIGTGCLANHWYDDASHLCGNRFCVNPSHLIWELPWDNMSRQGCHCYGHWSSGQCPHHPPCLPKPDMDHVMATLRDHDSRPTVHRSRGRR